jgi:hypothetical protein
VRLTVVDSSGARGTRVRTVHVRRATAAAVTPVPADGGGSVGRPGVPVTQPITVALLAAAVGLGLRPRRGLRALPV